MTAIAEYRKALMLYISNINPALLSNSLPCIEAHSFTFNGSEDKENNILNISCVIESIADNYTQMTTNRALVLESLSEVQIIGFRNVMTEISSMEDIEETLSANENIIRGLNNVSIILEKL